MRCSLRGTLAWITGLMLVCAPAAPAKAPSGAVDPGIRAELEAAREAVTFTGHWVFSKKETGGQGMLWRADATFDRGKTWVLDYWTMEVHRIAR